MLGVGALENKFPHPRFSTTHPSFALERRAEGEGAVEGMGGWVGGAEGWELTFVTTLSRGKVTARPLENQRGGEDRSGGFLLFISVDMLLLVFFQANGEGER